MSGDHNAVSTSALSVFDADNILETAYAYYNSGFMMLPRINVYSSEETGPLEFEDTERTVTQLDRVIGNYSFSMFNNSAPETEYYDKLAGRADITIKTGNLLVKPLYVPPGTKITLNLGACGNVVHNNPATNANIVFYGGLCLDNSTKGNIDWNGAGFVPGDTTTCYKCSETLLANNDVQTKCPPPLVLQSNVTAQRFDVGALAKEALDKVGISLTKENAYIGTASGSFFAPCGTCALTFTEFDQKEDGNLAIITGGKVEADLPADVTGINDYLLKYSCLQPIEEDRIKFIFHQGSINEETRYLTNYQPGMPKCDELVDQYCQNPMNIDTDECICYKELDAIVNRFGVTEIPYPVQCLGGCADNPKAYKRGSWAKQNCNVTVCTKFADLTGSQLISEGVTDLVCDGQSFVVSNNQPIVNYVQESPINGITQTTEWVLISIGILYFVLFVTWVGLYLYKKFGSRNS